MMKDEQSPFGVTPFRAYCSSFIVHHSSFPQGPAGRSRTYLNPRIRRVPGRSATAGKRPVRGLNPSHPVDSRAGTPASSQGGKDGRIRTLSARVGAALLSQEHILILV